MPVSSEEQEFVNHVLDLMHSIGPAIAKRMFGGHGIFLDGLMFALIANNQLYLKADKESESAFTENGLTAFSYVKQGKTYSMAYYQAPEAALEDRDVMRLWAGKAYDAALRAAAKK